MTKNRRAKQDARRLAEDSGVSYIQALRESQLNEILHGIPTPLVELTGIVGGWQPGQLIAVGARPGGGKTTFALNSAAAALAAGKSVLYFSLELEAKELLGWRSSLIGSTPRGNLERSLLEIDGSSQQFLSSIRARALQRSMSPAGLDLIIIDDLQLVGLPQANGERYDQMLDLSLGLKGLALELKVPVMVLAQMNRSSSEDAVSSISRLRDGGTLAQDSDLIILLGRSRSDQDLLELTVAKNRSGSIGRVEAQLRDVSFTLGAILRRPNPILQEYGRGLLADNLDPKIFLQSWTVDGYGTTKTERAEAKADILRFEEMLGYGIRSGDLTISQKVVRSIAESWADGVPMVSTEELTAWELGENGDSWFIEGTIDQGLAQIAVQRWIAGTAPDTLQNYYDHGQFHFSAHRDWYWEPISEEHPEGESILRRVSKHGASGGKPLFSGVHVSYS